MKKHLMFLVYVLIFWLVGACTVVRPDEVGIHTRLGRIIGEPFTQHSKFFNPFIASVVKFPIRVVRINLANLELPTKDALNVRTEIVFLYRLRPNLPKMSTSNMAKITKKRSFLALSVRLSAM